MNSPLNKFQPKAKREKKAAKQRRKDDDEIPASMMSKVEELVKARVDAQVAAKLEEQSRMAESQVSEPVPQPAVDARSSSDST